MGGPSTAAVKVAAFGLIWLTAGCSDSGEALPDEESRDGDDGGGEGGEDPGGSEVSDGSGGEGGEGGEGGADEPDEPEELPPGCECRRNAECQDGDNCNGRERCRDCVCVAGAPVDCDDGIDCTEDICNLDGDCYSRPIDSRCGAGGVCSVPTGGCIRGSCPVGQRRCGSMRCQDVTSDPDNCGGCRVECDPGLVCTDGECTCDASVEGSPGACGMCPREDRPGRLGEHCGLTAECHPDVLPPWEFQACLEAQCESGVCFFGVCTSTCERDEDCEEAADGPAGDDFTCYFAEDWEDAYCLPGSQRQCDSYADCPKDEVCRLLPDEAGHVVGSCGTSYKCAQGPGEACNLDPLRGPVQRCDEELCMRDGRCAGLCADDDHCDYQAGLECGPAERLFRGELTRHRFCEGELCDPQEGCPDPMWCGWPEWFDGDEIVELRCAFPSLDPDDLPLGAAGCNYDPDFGDIVECAEGLCRSRGPYEDLRCVLPCTAADDGDGDDGAGCDEDFACEPILFGAQREPGDLPLYVTYDSCVYAPGSDQLCDREGDCPEGETCAPTYSFVAVDADGRHLDADGERLRSGPDWAYLLESRCRPFDPDDAPIGEFCWEAEDCRNRMCVEDNSCVGICADSDDCEPGHACVITSFRDQPTWAWGGCTEWPGSGVPCQGPAGSCAALQGAEPDEVCLSNPLVDGPVEWRCGPSPGEQELGERCRTHDQCVSGLCATPFTGAFSGCTTGCVEDLDCDGPARCVEAIFFEREGIAEPSTARICLVP